MGDGVVSQHLGAGASETNFVGGYANNFYSAVRARTFSPISPLGMAATSRPHSIRRRT
jgi:hypothetical protein